MAGPQLSSARRFRPGLGEKMPHKTPSAGTGRAAAGGARLASLVMLVLFVVAAGLSLHGNRPPDALGTGAPPGEFSAARAKAVLVRILGDERPHPTGSEANGQVRDRIIAEFGR